jgi:hypothetical protein
MVPAGACTVGDWLAARGTADADAKAAVKARETVNGLMLVSRCYSMLRMICSE